MFERFSDSAASYVVLDSSNPSVYKQLYRAAKAKLKLRIRVSAVTEGDAPKDVPEGEDILNNNQLETLVTDHYNSANNDQAAVPRYRMDAYSSITPRYIPTAVAPVPSVAPRLATRICPVASFDAPPATFSHPFILKQISNNASDELRDAAPIFPMKSSAPLVVSHDQADLDSSPLSFVEHDKTIEFSEFTVKCNVCTLAINGAHYHCSICEHGDFDLCATCVSKGVHCFVDDHYLIKRLIENGKFVSSTQEKVPRKASKPSSVADKVEHLPGSFDAPEIKQEEKPEISQEIMEEPLPETLEMNRTCNSCVNGRCNYPLRVRLYTDFHSFRGIKLRHLHCMRGLRFVHSMPCYAQARSSSQPYLRPCC